MHQSFAACLCWSEIGTIRCIPIRCQIDKRSSAADSISVDQWVLTINPNQIGYGEVVEQTEGQSAYFASWWSLYEHYVQTGVIGLITSQTNGKTRIIKWQWLLCYRSGGKPVRSFQMNNSSTGIGGWYESRISMQQIQQLTSVIKTDVRVE